MICKSNIVFLSWNLGVCKEVMDPYTYQQVCSFLSEEDKEKVSYSKT